MQTCGCQWPTFLPHESAALCSILPGTWYGNLLCKQGGQGKAAEGMVPQPTRTYLSASIGKRGCLCFSMLSQAGKVSDRCKSTWSPENCLYCLFAAAHAECCLGTMTWGQQVSASK